MYPVVLNRVRDEALLDQAWAARVKKLQTQGGGPTIPPPARRETVCQLVELSAALGR